MTVYTDHSPITFLTESAPKSAKLMRWSLALQSHDVVFRYNIHPFNGPFFGTTQVGRYQKGKTNLDFTESRDSEWQWHQLGHMQICSLLQTDNHTSIPPLSFLQAGCPSCRPTNSVKALKKTKKWHKQNTYKTGKNNVAADCLSRMGLDGEPDQVLSQG